MSETVPIPFAAGEASGLSELSGAAPQLINFLIDSAGALRVRPGLSEWDEFPEDVPNASPVISMYSWRTFLVYVCEDRTIWALRAPGDVIALSDTSDATTMLDGSGVPIWTYDADRLAIAGGGQPQMWLGFGLSQRLAPTQTDPSGAILTLTHIGYSAQRFIGSVNSPAGYLQWTAPGVANHTTWPIVGAFYAEAEAAPDPVVALYVNVNEVYAFGTQTMQVYIPDPTYAFIPAASVQIGCIAPYSVIDTDGSFAWLDDRRRFVQSNGREFQVISTPLMAADINRPGFDVTGCRGWRITIGTVDVLVWSFPAEKRAIYYDRITKKWGEFRSRNENGEWVEWVVKSFWFWAEKNVHLVGLEDGTIQVMDIASSNENGMPLRALSRTGFQDRGTFVRKACDRVQVQIRRGGTLPSATAPTIEVRYRDTLGNFLPTQRVSTGVGGDYESVVDVGFSLGLYRARQWELNWSGGSDFLLAGAAETFTPTDV